MCSRLLGKRELQIARGSPSISSMASRTQRRKSVATWSLRERAVCSRPASGADQLGKPRLDVECGCPRARARRRTRLLRFLAGSCLDRRRSFPHRPPRRCPSAASMRAWACEPAMSCAEELRSKSIEALISSMTASGPSGNGRPTCGCSWSARAPERNRWQTSRNRRKIRLIALAAMAGAVAGTLAVYFMAVGNGNRALDRRLCAGGRCREADGATGQWRGRGLSCRATPEKLERLAFKGPDGAI